MKKIILLIAIIGLSFPAFSQSQSLEFNQVILITGADTVPAGKVWKVENIMYPILSYLKHTGNRGGTCSCGSGNSGREYETTLMEELVNGNCEINGTEYYYTQGILWLPEGTVLKSVTITSPIQMSTPASGCYCNYYIDGSYIGCGPYTPPQVSMTSIISVLEFNIIP